MAMKMENSGPDDEVTREQLAVMLNAYCKYKIKSNKNKGYNI